jgi:hypothetical protein
MKGKADLKIPWVVYQGEVVPTGTLPGRDQAPTLAVTCPDCGEALVVKRGPVRVLHAAHKGEPARCGFTAPETDLHYNAKMALAAALKGVSRLVVSTPCAGGPDGERSGDCTGAHVRDWIEGWTDVVPERRVQTRRPDVVLQSGDIDLAGVEVWVHNAVSEKKAADLEGWGFPWVEVQAKEILGEDGLRWRPSEPLPIQRCGPTARSICPACSVAFERREADRRAREAAREEAREAELARQAEQAALARERAASERKAEEAAARDFKAARLREAQEEAARRAAEATQRAKAFEEGARQMEATVKRDGLWIRRLWVFQQYLPDGRVMRDGLVIADRFVREQKEGSLLGVLSSLQVLEQRPPGLGSQAYTALKEAATAHLDQMRAAGIPVDEDVDWINLEHAGGYEGVVDWEVKGVDYRWPVYAAPPPPPWRANPIATVPDGLDLLRFLYRCVLPKMPVRYVWSPGARTWTLVPQSTPAP